MSRVLAMSPDQQAHIPPRFDASPRQQAGPQAGTRAGASSGHGEDGRLVSGEAVELDIRVARIGSRVLALLIDVCLQVILLYILLTVMTVLVLGLVLSGGDGDAYSAVLMIVIVIIVFIGYPVLLETLTGGRTLGKLALGLRVVRDDGGPIRFRHALTRALVGIALEWPGLMMPLVTWTASLATMLANPSGKRLGDLAAGTLVIHERTPNSWGWMPVMPPHLAGWAHTLDLTDLPDDLALAARHFLARNRRLVEPFRSRLGHSLAQEIAARTTPPAPPGVTGWMYLAAVVAERHRRAAHRLAMARTASAQIWPDLESPRPPMPR